MGRPKSVRTLIINTLLSDNEHNLINNNKVVPPSNPIWERLFLSLETKDRPANCKAVYTAALKFFSDKLKSKEIQELESVCLDSTTTSDLNGSVSDSVEIDSSNKFKIELSHKVWDTISPVEKEYSQKRDGKSRIYRVLRPGAWTNVIVDAVTKKRPLVPCSWSFEQNKCHLSTDTDAYLYIRAKCNTCGACLCGIMESEPEVQSSIN